MKHFALAIAFLAITVGTAHAQVRLDRLERLITHLERDVPSDRFDIHTWGTKPDASDPDYIGCAAGYATAIPEFRREGLTLVPNADLFAVAYGSARGVDAMVLLLGIPYADAYEVFIPGLYPSEEALRDPREAAAKLRRILARERRTIALEQMRRRPPCVVANW